MVDLFRDYLKWIVLNLINTQEMAFVNWNRIQASLLYPHTMAEKWPKYKKMGFGGGIGAGSNTQKTESPRNRSLPILYFSRNPFIKTEDYISQPSPVRRLKNSLCECILHSIVCNFTPRLAFPRIFVFFWHFKPFWNNSPRPHYLSKNYHKMAFASSSKPMSHVWRKRWS